MSKLKLYISLFVLLFVNFIFTYKYLSRISGEALYITIFLLLAQFLVFRFRHHLRFPRGYQFNLMIFVILIIVSAAALVHRTIPVESLNVDRWSVISSFLTELLNGRYPYFAKSHMGNFPGPMPVYFLIALPFHLIGELNILSALGFIFILIMIYRRQQNSGTETFLMFYVITAGFMYWEIAVRSNIFSYTLLALIVLRAFIKDMEVDKPGTYILAILTGLMLSTRSIYILVYVIFFLPLVIRKGVQFKRVFILIFIAFLAFLSSFLPFIISFPDEFIKMNPFVIQSSFLIPEIYTLIFIVLAVVLAFFVKSNSDRIFYSGMSLFISILIYSIYHIARLGFDKAFIESKIDISYFIFCIPFLMLYLLSNIEDEIAVMHPRKKFST